MLTQSFGDSVASIEADNVTAIEFDSSGNYLATGDRGGRIVVFRGVKSDPRKSGKLSQGSPGKMWSPYFQFQSHECEFDYLKSLEIEEKIGHIRFCKAVSNNLLILSTNDKTVKLWKIYEKNFYVPSARESIASGGSLCLPRNAGSETATQSYQRRAYQNAHAYNINSITLSNDGETFASADDLRINCWNLEHSDRCFTLVDIKPLFMEDLKEVITCSQYAPSAGHLIFYSTSRGAIKLVDTRTAATCDTTAQHFDEPDDGSTKTFFTEITNSIADFKVSPDSRYVWSRDFMTVKLWDTHMTSGPIQKFAVHDHLKSSMYELYESESVFDKFQLAQSPDGQSFVTGSYSNQFSIWNKTSGRVSSLQLPMPAPGASRNVPLDSTGEIPRFAREIHIACPSEPAPIRADQKVLHCAWHPFDNTIAVAGQAGLYLYKL